ncbi:MAG: zinc-binding alcohol dehydrogenase family protein [Verrucomicrobia bacterium]|nr:zinc-binding alcohol dehydrogenase family protein [Verrucomicrobiota bacterium]
MVLQKPEVFVESSGLIPVVGEGEALIRVRRIGVCGTDIHAFYGRQPFFEYPRILGHELGGEVISCGGSDLIQVGDLCCVEPYMNNPLSQASLLGKSNCCEELQCMGVHCDGGMRKLIKVPVDKVHVSSKLKVNQLALVEMLCIGAHAVDRAKVEKGEYAMVVGAGPIGMSVMQFLQAAGIDVAVMDMNAGRLDFCREALGVKKILQVKERTDVEAEMRDLGGGDLPSVIFDATGNAKSMMANFDRIAHGGRIVFLGELSFDDPNFHRREISLFSSRNATAADFRRVISMIESGKIDTSPWITHRMQLADVPKQFRGVVEDPALRKAVIEV